MKPEITQTEFLESQEVAKRNFERILLDQRLHYLRSYLSEQQLNFTFKMIQKDSVSKLIGLLAHFVYWAVFGGFNPLPIDNYHLNQMLKTILELHIDLKKEIVSELVSVSTSKPQVTKG